MGEHSVLKTNKTTTKKCSLPVFSWGYQAPGVFGGFTYFLLVDSVGWRHFSAKTSGVFKEIKDMNSGNSDRCTHESCGLDGPKRCEYHLEMMGKSVETYNFFENINWNGGQIDNYWSTPSTGSGRCFCSPWWSGEKFNSKFSWIFPWSTHGRFWNLMCNW